MCAHWPPSRRRRALAPFWQAGLCAALLLSAGQAAAAQSDDAGKGPVVLVLKRISEKFVKPVTGVVIEPGDRVVVPAEFVSAGDEIVVLDGGTDMARNGRPTQKLGRTLEGGLAILQVPGLRRRPAELAAEAPVAGDTLLLVAFPPAEELARGENQVRRPERLVQGDTGATPPLAPEQAWPNVSGPLFNDCGQLAGFNLAAGTPSLQASAEARVLLAEQVAEALGQMDATPARVACHAAAAGRPAAAAGKPEPATPAPPPESAQAEAAGAAPGEPPAGVPPQQPQMPDGPARRVPAAPAQGPSVTWLGGMALAALLAAGWLWRNYRRPAIAAPPIAPAEAAAQAPVTVRMSARPPGEESQTREASLRPGTAGLIIGTPGTELPIDSSAVAHRHARLCLHGGMLAISDLGSGMGTFVNGIPCLEGEVMLLGPEDRVVLGDVACRFILAQPAGAPR